MPRREATPKQAAAAASDPELDLTQVRELVEEIDPRGNLIALLQRTQDVFGYLPEPVVDEIARLSGVPASRIYGIITFYAQFTTVPTRPAQGLRVPRHRLSRGRRHAHHRGHGAGTRGR